VDDDSGKANCIPIYQKNSCAMSGAVKRCHPKNIGIVRLWKKKS
jgi:hypothetical protein